MKFRNPRAEEMRLRALYRRQALVGRMRLPLVALRAFVGPDCAYHLYRHAVKDGGRDES